ncbi:MAG: ABC transporter ATP-binding protein [Bacteroidota bacterium]
MSIIHVHNLYKTFEAAVPVKAIRGINLEFAQGEFSAVVGPSGSGKTTFLNMIGGLDSPTEGDIIINDTNIRTLSPSEMIDFRLYNIGFVFQAYNLIPVLTARENVEFIMQLQKRPQKECTERAMELLEAVGLQNRANTRPAKLSGGQQQRVAVARALASKPQFVLADEPTANLDTASTENLLDIMHNLNMKEDVTFIFSTHDKRVIDKARRIVTIEDGKVLSDDTIKR